MIACFLVLQVALPLRYYLGGTPTEERFSWRMFSSVRSQACTVSVTQTMHTDGRTATQPVDLDNTLHRIWISRLEAYQPAVVEAFLNWQLDRTDASALRYERRCTATDGSALPVTTINIDRATRTLTVTQGDVP